MRLLKDPEVRVKDVARRFGVSVGTVYKQVGCRGPGEIDSTMATRYKDRITILELTAARRSPHLTPGSAITSTRR